MDQVLEFGKRYGKWIAAGVVASVATVVGVLAYNQTKTEDLEVEIIEIEPKDSDEE